MDNSPQNGTNGHVNPGVSLRMGPVSDEMDVDKPATNGTKRKSSMTNGRKSYKEESVSDDDVPLVSNLPRFSSPRPCLTVSRTNVERLHYLPTPKTMYPSLRRLQGNHQKQVLPRLVKIPTPMFLLVRSCNPKRPL